MKKRALLALLLLPFALSAQQTAPLIVEPQSNVRIPWGLDNLSVVDGHLFGYSKGVIVCAPITGQHLRPMQPDTLFSSKIHNADYIVRNPRDSMLYFTCQEEDGSINLYTYDNRRFRKTRRIDIHGWNRDICHPTFSSNGNMMIFASRGKVGLGGFDLWCSLWNGHRWTRPINMGNIINTPGNDINPVFYHNYLVYSSDSIPGSKPGYHLYAVRLREATGIDDIIFDTYTIQALPEPVNSTANDMNIAFSTATNQGFWISNRTGSRQLYSFNGLLEGITLSGTVTDNRNIPIPDADIRIFLNGRLANSTRSDSTGHYHLFVLANDNYQIQVVKNNFYHYETTLALVHDSQRQLLTLTTHNVRLTSLPLNYPMMIQNIFVQETGSEISGSANSDLKPIISYLRDNPHISAQFTVYCDPTDDETFNNILIEHRIKNLYQHILSLLPSSTQFSIINGNKAEEIEPSESGANFILVTLMEKTNN